jgi:hypothetical protein
MIFVLKRSLFSDAWLIVIMGCIIFTAPLNSNRCRAAALHSWRLLKLEKYFF